MGVGVLVFLKISESMHSQVPKNLKNLPPGIVWLEVLILKFCRDPTLNSAEGNSGSIIIGGIYSLWEASDYMIWYLFYLCFRTDFGVTTKTDLSYENQNYT